MDPLSGPFSPETIKRAKKLEKERSLRKNPSTLSLDRVQTNTKNKLSINTSFSSHHSTSKKSDSTPLPSPSTKRSFAPKVLPEPILMPKNAIFSTTNPNSDGSLDSNSRLIVMPEEDTEVLRSGNASIASSSSSSFNSQLQSSHSTIFSSTNQRTNRGLGIRSASSSVGERSTWSDDEDEEEVEEISTGSNLFPFRSRPSVEHSQLIEAIPGLEADDLPGAKARKVLGLNSEGFELGPGADSPSASSSSFRETRRHSNLLPGVLGFVGKRRNSLGMEINSTSTSLRPSLNFKRVSQLGSPLLSATPSPRSSTASPLSATKEHFTFNVKSRNQESSNGNGVTDSDQSDWESILESAARSAQIHSSQLLRLQKAAGRHPSSSSIHASMPRRGSADTALDQAEFRRSLKKQSSFNNVSDFITSYEMTRSKSYETNPSPPQTSGTARKIFITPLNLPSPEAVRNAGRVRGRNNSGRPKHDPNPLPAWTSASRSRSVSSDQGSSSVGLANLSRPGSAAGHFAGEFSSTSNAIQVQHTPPRPARSHLRSASDSRGIKLASQLNNKEKRLESSPNTMAEIELLTSSSHPSWSQGQSSFSSTRQGVSSNRAASSLGGSTNASPEPVLSISSSSPGSSFSQPTTSKEELEIVQLTSPALAMHHINEESKEEPISRNEETNHDYSELVNLESNPPIHPALVTISPPASSAFLSPPRTAPVPPSPVPSSTSSGGSHNSGGRNISSHPFRSSVSSIKAVKKMSNLFKASSSKPNGSSSSLQSSLRADADREVEQKEEKQVKDQTTDEDGFIILQVPSSNQDQPSLPQIEAPQYPQSARSSYLSTSSLRYSVAEGQESDDFTRALSSLSFFDGNSVDKQPISRSRSSNFLSSTFDSKDGASSSSESRSTSATRETESAIRDSMFSQDFRSPLSSSTPFSSEVSSSLHNRAERSRSKILPDVPRPMSLASESSLDFDFDFEPEFLRNKLDLVPGPPLKESETRRDSQLLPIEGVQVNKIRNRDQFRSSIYSRSSTEEESQDVLDLFKLQGFEN